MIKEEERLCNKKVTTHNKIIGNQLQMVTTENTVNEPSNILTKQTERCIGRLDWTRN